ncbi:hypothetical protein F5B21DRAFT_527025 [Xylaria acuta]|nr:hypothetical protein F5B21DRAFT_527025 [Xylaria acuta]
MERLCQVLMTLALVVPVLAAPGLMPTTVPQQPVNQQPMNKAWVPLKRHHPYNGHSTERPPAGVSQSTSMDPSPLSSSEATTMSSPTELLKRKSDKKPDNQCTPGDRYCHASLQQVLFCNDDGQWVTYSECPQGTMCHRLHMICVPEKTSDNLGPYLHSQRADDDDPHQCKEGDRRCSETFNRVDRCNRNHEWVTYHDCRMAELCDGKLLECIPITDSEGSGLKPHGTVTPNGTANMPM